MRIVYFGLKKIKKIKCTFVEVLSCLQNNLLSKMIISKFISKFMHRNVSQGFFTVSVLLMVC